MDVRPLKGNEAVAAALRSPLRFTSGPLAATIGSSTAPTATLQYVVSAGRRTVRRAVHRNRIKRLLREALRNAVRTSGASYANAGLTTVFAIWRVPPPATTKLRLCDVEPHVTAVLRQACVALERRTSNAHP